MFIIDVYWIFKTLALISGGLFVVWFATLMGRQIASNKEKNYIIKIFDGKIKMAKVRFMIVVESLAASIFGSAIVSVFVLQFYRLINVFIVAFILSFPSILYSAFKTLPKLIEQEKHRRQKEEDEKKEWARVLKNQT